MRPQGNDYHYLPQNIPRKYLELNNDMYSFLLEYLWACKDKAVIYDLENTRIEKRETKRLDHHPQQ